LNALSDPRSLGGRELLTHDEARRIAANIAKLLLRSRGTPETISGLLWPGAGPSAAKGYPLSLTGGTAGNPMDQRIESFLGAVTVRRA
jgi:hypothetical protein